MKVIQSLRISKFRSNHSEVYYLSSPVRSTGKVSREALIGEIFDKNNDKQFYCEPVFL